jgi:TusA-related sulfurtransferase
MQPNPEIFDLKSTRCPEAMLHVRKAIDTACSKNFKGRVLIKTIEPSMERDLPFYINQVSGAVSILNTHKQTLKQETKQRWITSNEAIEEDLTLIEFQYLYELEFK